jgi:hypothetical protein
VEPERTWSGRGVLVHLLVVVGLTVGYVVLLVIHSSNDGANIGAGLVALPLLFPLGLPWSVPYLANPYAFDDWPGEFRAVVMLGPAYVNVVLHALWRRKDLLPGKTSSPSPALLKRAAFLSVLAYVLAVSLNVILNVTVHGPGWLGIAASGGAVSFVTVLFVWRLVRQRSG